MSVLSHEREFASTREEEIREKNKLRRATRAVGGFTFIEVLLVVGITVIISLVSVLALSGWRRQYDLNTTAQKIATLLKDAQSKAMTQESGTAWGVYFNNSTSTSPYFALFKSTAYSTATQVEYFTLPSSLVFNSSTLPAGATSSIVFRQISGEVDSSASFKANGVPINSLSPFSLNIFFGSNNPGNNQSSTIDITNIGRIRFVTLSCFVVCSQTTVVLTPPTLMLTANPTSITSGQSSVISWTTTDATSCDATWTPSKKIADSKTVSPAVTTAYPMICTGSGGSVNQSVAVTVTFPQPTLTLFSLPDELPAGGGNVTLQWSSTNTNSCSATWTNKKQTSGSQQINNLTQTTIFEMTCVGPGWEVTSGYEVYVDGSSGGSGGSGGGFQLPAKPL